MFVGTEYKVLVWAECTAFLATRYSLLVVIAYVTFVSFGDSIYSDIMFVLTEHKLFMKTEYTPFVVTIYTASVVRDY